MGSKRRKQYQEDDRRISWNRVARIFGNAKSPMTIWERQFDHMDHELRRLASTPYEEIDFSDLWYYFGDLTYCELQPDLFNYLFPVCLIYWHETLMRDEPCQREFEFHHAMHNGRIFERMMNEERRQAVFDFFRDSFLKRLDAEGGLPRTPVKGRCSVAWIFRFNSLGVVMPHIKQLWNPWWELETPGRAVAALEYCSGLMYFDGENSVFPEWEGFSPPLYVNDSCIYDAGWLPENVEFLGTTLTLPFVEARVCEAAERLQGEPEEELANRLREDLPACRDLIGERVKELPELLARTVPADWTV